MSDWPAAQRALEAGIDFERANAARMYDYYLGGAHNFAVDREAAARVAAADPDISAVAHANRGFLGRVVRWCTDHGIDQFLDLGSGVPTVGNVHEIAHRTVPTARVAYVDFEPVAVAHAEAILVDEPWVTVTLVPGSAVAISHGITDYDDPELARRVQEAVATYARSATPITLRSRAELRALLDGLDLVEPGLVDVRDWPEPHPERPGAGTYGALARLPA